MLHFLIHPPPDVHESISMFGYYKLSVIKTLIDIKAYIIYTHTHTRV